MAYLTFFLLFVLFILYNLMLIVPMREVCVIERLGKFRAVLGAGFHILIPRPEQPRSQGQDHGQFGS